MREFLVLWCAVAEYLLGKTSILLYWAFVVLCDLCLEMMIEGCLKNNTLNVSILYQPAGNKSYL